MTVILILVVLWGVVLGIPAARWIQRRSGQGSIDSFHHSLDTLERSGPKLVVPAYRLSGSAVEETQQRGVTSSGVMRPKLVLLRLVNTEEGEAMYHEDEAWNDDYSGERYERLAPEHDGYAYDDEYFGAQVPQGSSGRRLAAAKRRKIVLTLAGACIGTLILGFAVSVLWDVSVLALILLVAYVGVMARAALSEGDSARERPSIADRVRERMGQVGAQDDYDDEFDDTYEDEFDAPVAHRGGQERHIAHGVASSNRRLRQSEDYVEEDDWYDEPRRAVGR